MASEPESSRPNEWDDYAPDWDADTAARAYSVAAFGSLVEVAEHHGVRLAGARVLDFGCGTGLLTEQLVASSAAIDAVDTSTAMLAVLDAKIREHRWRAVTTSTELPDVGSAHDLVACSSVCSFLDDYPATVQRLVSFLRPGGVFVQWDWERDPADAESHGLSRVEIGDALQAAGLESVTVEIGFVASVGEQTIRPLVGHGRKLVFDDRRVLG